MALKLVSRNTEPKQNSDKEGWGSYIARNIAKTPMLGYQALRSGLGAGHVLGTAAEELGAPQAVKTGLSYLLPTPEQAREEYKQFPTTIARNVIRSAQSPLNNLLFGSFANEALEQKAQQTNFNLPDYLTQSRPEDYYAEQAIQAAPFLAQGAAQAGLKGAAKTAGVIGSALGFGKVGGGIGKEIGEAIGAPKTGEALGEFAGGLGGAYAAHYAMNRPSKTISPKIKEIQQAAFEAEKTSAAAALEAEKATLLVEQEGILKEASKAHRDAMLELPKQKAQFEAGKKDRINKINQEVSGRLKQIDDLAKIQQEGYAKAKTLEGDATGSADMIRNAVKKADQELTGMTVADKTAIWDALKDIDSVIVDGQIPLKEVTNIQKNLNDYRYNRNISVSALKRINPIVQAMNEYIKKVGSPEFNESWQAAESATRQIKDLYGIKRKGTRTPVSENFFKSKAEQVKEISKEKFSPELEAQLKQVQNESKQAIKKLETDQKKAQQLLGKETMDRIKLDPTAVDKLADFITKYGPMAADKLSAVTLGYFAKMLGFPSQKLATALVQLGKMGHAELKIAKNAWEHHPAIYKDFAQGITAATVGDFPKAATLINHGAQKIEKTKENKKRGLTKISSGPR